MADLLATWLVPVAFFAVVLGAGLWISRTQIRSYQRHVDEVKAVNAEATAISREMIAELREIKQLLKERG